ncbi:DinB family protein [Flavihumibacter sp. UBA7668]|uniref:DinB family protein n=1 Tax=Flavihumibacter sp. UBA7668 TaxID=1946542 RepID=UPI0025C5FA5D|nr:DinB family protein [Flavihumibacter sp. UBA7668]
MQTSASTSPEWWQRGPLEGILPVFQPAAHALLQARDELTSALNEYPDSLLWQPLYGMASVGFHLQHIAGVLDRLITYANGNVLSEEQMDYLKEEGKGEGKFTCSELLFRIKNQVDQTLNTLAKMQPDAPELIRTIGRKKIPTTQLGLVFHAAEHMMRHTGQVLVTSRVLIELNKQSS